MKVMTYNILCGGHPVAGGSARMADILSVIASEAPDILALQECTGFEDGPRMNDVARAVGLAHWALARGAVYDDGLRYGAAIFSRYPLRDTHVFAEDQFQAAALATECDTPLGRLALCNVHLHAFSEAARLVEIEDVMARQRGRGAQIVMGDFNAISRVDCYPADTQEFELRTDVTDLVGQDLKDVMADAPAPSHFSPLRADHDRRVMRRIDYIFASDDLAGRVRDAYVHRSETADRASDHYPVVAQFG